MTNLYVGWASSQAAAYACKHWHYSRSVPAFGTVNVGVWEEQKFIGVVMFSRGASAQIARPFKLPQTQVCELTRIALTQHATPVSKLISIAVRMLRQQSPGVRVIVSFADESRGHHGGIYQASNWIYTGGSETTPYRIRGRVMQGKSVTNTWGTQQIEWLRRHVDASAHRFKVTKHRYVLALDDEMRKVCETLRKPHPKRPKHAMVDDQSAQRRGSTDPAAPPDNVPA